MSLLLSCDDEDGGRTGGWSPDSLSSLRWAHYYAEGIKESELQCLALANGQGYLYAHASVKLDGSDQKMLRDRLGKTEHYEPFTVGLRDADKKISQTYVLITKLFGQGWILPDQAELP